MDASDFREKLMEARMRVDSMDDIDGERDRSLETIRVALECGLRNPETGAEFDALVMLGDLIDDNA